MQKIVVRTSFHLATKIDSIILPFTVGIKRLAGICLLASLVACQTTSFPVEEQTIARTALEAARVVESARYSPGHWHQAEEAYRKGQLYIKDREFEKARTEFLKSRVSAEKAENSARLIRQKNGEVL